MRDLTDHLRGMDWIERITFTALVLGITMIGISAVPLAAGIGIGEYVRPMDSQNAREHGEIFGMLRSLDGRITDINTRLSTGDAADRSAEATARLVTAHGVQIAVNTGRIDRIESFGIAVVLAAFGACLGVGATAVFTRRTYKMIKVVHDALPKPDVMEDEAYRERG